MKAFLSIFLFAILIVSCCDSRPVINCETYQEAIDPDSTDYSSEWNGVKGFNASFGSTNIRYEKSRVPLDNEQKISEWSGSAWKGECLSAMLLLWSSEKVQQIECEFSDFEREDGRTLDSNIANGSFVRYTISDSFGPGCGDREDLAPVLVADVLDTIPCIDMDAKTTRPVWLSFNIPADATSGVYKSTLKIYAKNQRTQTLNVSIEILDHTLPRPPDWKFHLDLWQHPTAVARVNDVEVWSEEHWELLEKPMEMLANAGQKVITATLNKEPWNNQCYDAYADMILWTKTADGGWRYDYAVFDRWVSMMMGLGVKSMINCYSLVPWNNEIHYYDETVGELINISAVPGSNEFVELWTPFLKDFKRHLNEKGWLEITNIAMDERAPDVMKAALGLLKEVAPELGVALADNKKSYREYPWLKDICVSFGSTFDEADLQYRKDNNLISTYYTYCATEFPNVFTFSDPSEAVYISWYAMAGGYDGYLRWAYNSWNENPLFDSRFSTWAAGDSFIVYPGRSSIRFERLREGIQDAEKIRILRELFIKNSDTAKLNELNGEVAKFNIHEKPSVPCAQMIDNAKRVLDKLSR